MQYAQPLASGSRPSWSRPTRAHSWRTRRRTMTTGTLCRQRAGSGGGGPMTEASGCAVRTPDSLLRGPVSTALTLPSLPANHPAEIVGILRFFFGVQRRCGVDVSTVDTHTPSCSVMPRPSAALASRATSLPRVPARASVSEVMTLRCLRSEETTQYPQGATSSLRIRTREWRVDDAWISRSFLFVSERAWVDCGHEHSRCWRRRLHRRACGPTSPRARGGGRRRR